MVFLEKSIFSENLWSYLKDNSWTDSTTMRNLGIEAYNLLDVVGVALLVFSIIILVIKWICSRKVDKKNCFTGPLINKLIIAVFLGGFVYFVNLVCRIVDIFAARLIS